MQYIIVGLGNPGEEYAKTRHNVGRVVIEAIAKECGGDLEYDKKSNSLVASCKIGKAKAVFVAPETFMNNSGKAVASFIKSKKAVESLIVIYDDFNLPLGRMKISYNRSSGGHNGLESVIKAVKTEGFVRIRIGTAPMTAKGDAKVPHGEEKIEKFILGPFKDEEMKIMKKVSKSAIEAVRLIIGEGREKAMNEFNSI